MAYDTYKCPDFPQCPSLPSHFTCVEVYTVKAGDTLYAISQAYGVPVVVLMQVNRILNPYNLKIGQKICIPGKQGDDSSDNENNGNNNGSNNGNNDGNNNNGNGGNNGSDNGAGGGNGDNGNAGDETETPECSGTIHTIAKGETLYMIAKKHRVPLGLIMRANPGIDPYNLRIGQKICIPPFPPNRPQRPGCPGRPQRPGRPQQPTRPGVPANCSGQLYATQRGDTLTRILDRFDITYGQLLAANPDVDFEESLESLTLCIPVQNSDSANCREEKQYTIKEGDTLDSISQMFGMISDRLLMANPEMTTADFTIVGTVVCIPD